MDIWGRNQMLRQLSLVTDGFPEPYALYVIVKVDLIKSNNERVNHKKYIL